MNKCPFTTIFATLITQTIGHRTVSYFSTSLMLLYHY